MDANVSPPGFLAHHDGDLVAVATRDLSPGDVEGGYLRGPASVTIRVKDDVPLGHKVSLTDISAGDKVIEYGRQVAIATQNIAKGDYVHVHNVRSARWHNSVA